MEYKAGDIINHSRFGLGEILNITSEMPPTVTVAFEESTMEFQLNDSFTTKLLPIPNEESEETDSEMPEDTLIEDNEIPDGQFVVSFPCSGTYDLVNEICVHAHPVRPGYPVEVFPYLMVRAQGGVSDKLFKVIDTVELNPLNFKDRQQLSVKYNSVKEFIKRSIPILGYQPSPAKYRFYVLKPIYTFDPPYIMDPNPRSYRYIPVEELGLPSAILNSISNSSVSTDKGSSFQPNIVGSQMDGNLAIKCNYCDGGSEADHIGFTGICSDRIREYNIEVEKRVWCTNERCPCYQYYKHRITKEQLISIMSTPSDFVCYESTMLSDWKTQAGLTEYGETKRFGSTLHKNAACIFTTRLPNMEERDRFIFGIFLVDEVFHGDDEKSGYVKCNTKYHIELKPTEARKIKYWNYYRNKNHPEREQWGTGLYRFISNQGIINILKDLIALRDDESKQEVISFLNEFCRLNNIRMPEFNTISEKKPIVSFPCGGTYGIVLETGVHAHPLKKGFPSKVSPYLMVRANGGASSAVYQVLDTVDLNPLDQSAVQKLSSNYECVEEYINMRKRTFGFKNAPTPYRFYILRKVYVFEHEYVMTPNTQGHKYLSFADIGIDNSDLLKIDKTLFKPSDNMQKQLESENQAIEIDIQSHNLEGLERTAVVKARINQGAFRDMLIQKYHKCCLCGVDEESLLVASHIKPWADSTRKERVDDNNGLLLCPNHDRLFDRGYITFNDDGNIVISDALSDANQIYMNVNSDITIEMTSKTTEYMKYHRNTVYEKWKKA